MNPASPDRSEPPAEHAWWAFFDPRKNLAARAALWVGAAATLLIAALVWLAGSLIERQIRDAFSSKLESLAVQVSDKLDRALAEQSRALQFAATTLAPLDSTGRRLRLGAILASSPDLAWVGFADASGQIVTGSQGLLENTDASLRPWFLGARRQPFFSDVTDIPELAQQAASENGAPPRFITLAAAATTPEGQFLGVLVAQWKWQAARDLQGTVLTEAERRSQISITLYNEKGEAVLDSSTALNGGAALPAPAIPNARLARGALTEDIRGEGVYFSGYARSAGLRGFRGLKILTVVRQPSAEIVAPVVAVRKAVARWGVVFAAVLSAAAWLTTARITRRLRVVTASADKVREGDIFTVMPRPTGADELSQMNRALDDLVEDFRKKLPKAPPPKVEPEIELGARRKNHDISKYI